MPEPIKLLSVPLLSETTGSAILLVGSFMLLLLGAEIFTNGVEWLGRRLGIAESATGSILAAVGTALPETVIPVIAIFFQSGEGVAAVGVGAILGAPFLLATVAMFLIGLSVFYFASDREHGRQFRFNKESTRRDLSFFLVGYTLAFLAALVPYAIISVVIGIFLVLLYVFYVYRSLKSGELGEEAEELDDLYLGQLTEWLIGRGADTVSDSRHGYASDPPLWFVLCQTVLALAFIVGGAQLFVTEIEFFSNEVLNIPGALIALLLAPFATELPEKFNSIIWIMDDKDTLAIGNITGAMAFQGTLPVTLGIIFTSWDLSFMWGTTGFLNGLSAILAIVSGAIVYLRVRQRDENYLRPGPFLIGGLFYAFFIAIVLYHVLVLGIGGAG